MDFAKSCRKYRRAMMHTGGVKYDAGQLRSIYRFPTDATGKGQLIVCIELGGGDSQADFSAYRLMLGLPPKQLQRWSYGGAVSSPSTPDSADGEVMLDIEVATGTAPDADIGIVYAPNTLDGFVGGMSLGLSLKPAALSCSWGESEGQDPTSVSFENQMNGVLKPASVASLTTILAASGDNGSSDGQGTGDHVDFFSSNPYVLGCGGTSMPTANAMSRVETVWNNGQSGGATGGGTSSIYNRPPYQNNVGLPSGNRRCVPDWAAVADPGTGIYVVVDGQYMVIGGTSAVAPFGAGVIACLNQKLGRRLGFVNPALYALVVNPVTYALCFNDITSGNNGTYIAKPGPDLCTGLGSPNVDQLALALAGNGPPPPPPPPPTVDEFVIKNPGTYRRVA